MALPALKPQEIVLVVLTAAADQTHQRDQPRAHAGRHLS